MIEREVVAKKRKAPIVCGDIHDLHRMPPPMPGPMAGTIASLLETACVKVFSVWTFTELSAELPTLQPAIATWTKPSFTLMEDMPISEAQAGELIAGRALRGLLFDV